MLRVCFGLAIVRKAECWEMDAGVHMGSIGRGGEWAEGMGGRKSGILHSNSSQPGGLER